MVHVLPSKKGTHGKPKPLVGFQGIIVWVHVTFSGVYAFSSTFGRLWDVSINLQTSFRQTQPISVYSTSSHRSPGCQHSTMQCSSLRAQPARSPRAAPPGEDWGRIDERAYVGRDALSPCEEGVVRNNIIGVSPCRQFKSCMAKYCFVLMFFSS